MLGWLLGWLVGCEKKENDENNENDEHEKDDYNYDNDKNEKNKENHNQKKTTKRAKPPPDEDAIRRVCMGVSDRRDSSPCVDDGPARLVRGGRTRVSV